MDDAELIEAARRRRDEAAAQLAQVDADWKRVVLEVAARSGVRAAAEVARVRPNTVSDWKKQATE